MDVHAYTLNCKQTLPYFVVGVQNFSLYQYALYDVSNVHDKFHSYTTDVQVAATNYNHLRANLVVYVQT